MPKAAAPGNTRLQHVSALAIALATGWAPMASGADAPPAASVPTIRADIEAEQGAMEAEIRRVNEERQRLESKEREVQKALKEQSQRLLEQQHDLDEQARLIKEQQRSFDEQKRRMDELKVKIEDLALPPVPPLETPPPEPSSAAPTVPVAPAAPAAPVAPPAAPPPTPSGPPPAVPSVKDQPEPPVGRAPQPDKDRPAQVADLLEQRGILTPRGTLVVEPSLQYVNSSVTRVALEGFTIIPSITIGSIDVRSVDRNTFTTAVALRYGITSRIEAEVRVPYVRRDDHTTTRPLAQPAEADRITTVSGSGLGDVELGAHYQINEGGKGWPYFVANLRVKSRTGDDPFDIPTDPATGLQTGLPTGSGFWAIQPAITVSLPSDPAVFFSSLSYLWNLERKVNNDIGTIDPGDALGFGFGMGLALNENASFSLGYSHNSVEETRQDGNTVKGSRRLQIGTLLIGMSHRAGRRSSVNFGLGIGVTDDAPNAQVSLRLPMSVVLRK